MKTPRGLLLLTLGAVLLSACPRHAGRPTQVLDEAVERARGGDATARVQAFAGFHALLVAGDPRAAQASFDRALAAHPAEPWALYGQIAMAKRRAHPERVLALSLDLCERAPSHPLAAVAAREVNDLSGVAASMDDLILKRAPVAIGRGLKGDAAYLLRSALAHIHDIRVEDAPHRQLLSDMGVITDVSLAGPFSPHHLLTFDELTPPEKSGALDGPWDGPLGPIVPRRVPFSDGNILLAGEGNEGDMFVLATDLDVPVAATHILRTVTSAAHKVYLDGELLFSRRTMDRVGSSVTAVPVELSAGKHRVLVKLAKNEGSGTVTLSAMRADGRPAELRVSAAKGAAPSWRGEVRRRPSQWTMPEAADLFRLLEDEAGAALAAYTAVDDAMRRDREGAKRLLALLEGKLESPAFYVLRAEVMVGDRTVPAKVSRGRATRDLELASAKDPGEVRALLLRSQIAVEDGRLLEAAELVRQARGDGSDVGFPVALQQARVELALDVDAQAEQSALEALERVPGVCEAIRLRYTLARRRDAIALTDELVQALQPCPGALGQLADHLRARGNFARAEEVYRLITQRDPASISASLQLAALLASAKRYDEAEQELKRIAQLWPRHAEIYRRLGDIHAVANEPDEALRAREQALRLDGGNLPLRRLVERARTGKELLEDHAIRGRDAIAVYEAGRGAEDAAAAYVLDAAAIQVFPDGAQVDRIHTIQKVLDRSEVGDVAEVSVPAGAAVLALRTVKADGTVLEPENIEGKDTVSLPGVEVGDYIEFEYLYAHPRRSPALPGWSATNFYFQIARRPNAWTTYKVIAPKGSGIAADPHNMTTAQPEQRADADIFFHEERQVPPFIPEPDAPPSASEYLPFVAVGAGTEGNEALVREYADTVSERARLTFELEQFAKQARGDKRGVEALRALHAAVMERIQGPDAGLGQTAASTLAQDRGSRLMTLKAVLEASEIPARIALVRTFSADPAPYRFPNEQLLTYACLRVELEGKTYWIDTSVRFSPFGDLPDHAEGGFEAFLLPEATRPLAKVKTPPANDPPVKQVSFELQLAEDGSLTGTGREVYTGMEAAELSEALEQITPEQRTQALQGAISRYFGGAEMKELKLDYERKVGSPLTMSYAFRVPRFGRLEGEGRMVLPPVTLPARLGRRYVQLGSRRTPLFIASSDESRTEAKLTLPEGWSMQSLVPEVKLANRYGGFVRREKQDGRLVTISEDYRLLRGRIPPAEYESFAQFAGELDLLQARDVSLVKRTAPKQ